VINYAALFTQTLHALAFTPLLLFALQESSEYETDESEEEGAPGRPKLVRPVFVRKQEREVGFGEGGAYCSSSSTVVAAAACSMPGCEG
jgi:hypothetical protein